MRLNKKKKIVDLLSTLEEGFYYAKSSSYNKSKLMLYDFYYGLISILKSVEEDTIRKDIKSTLQKFE